MHLRFDCKTRFIGPVMTTSKMTTFSNVARLKELNVLLNDLPRDSTSCKCYSQLSAEGGHFDSEWNQVKYHHSFLHIVLATDFSVMQCSSPLRGNGEE